VCNGRFDTYDELKTHRQIHDKKVVEIGSTGTMGFGGDVAGGGGPDTVVVHSRVGALSDISNRGGVKCGLCSAFKLRKDHLRTHYIKHHGYDPKAAKDDASAAGTGGNGDEGDMLASNRVPCSACHEMFASTSHLIKHLLKAHCHYSGLICPYCRGHHPERYLDLQTHVTQKHIDMLTGYNVSNTCKVCQERFPGYAELRDHVQTHGDAYREPYGQRSSRKRRAPEASEEEEPANEKSFAEAEEQPEMEESEVARASGLPHGDHVPPLLDEALRDTEVIGPAAAVAVAVEASPTKLEGESMVDLADTSISSSFLEMLAGDDSRDAAGHARGEDERPEGAKAGGESTATFFRL